MSDLAQRLEQLSPEKRELFLRALGRPATPAPGEEPASGQDDRILPRDRSVPPPLSLGQQRLWFLDRFDPGSSTYNLCSVFEIGGPLEEPVFEAVVREIVRRHEVLRTTFSTVGGEPVQVIAPAPRPRLPVIDLSALPAASRQPEASRLAGRLAHMSFDLGHGPLIRVTLLRLAAELCVVVVATHHIVSDDWSILVLGRELLLLYQAFARGAASPLPELAVQYADFASWQRARLRGKRLDDLLDFWRADLRGAPRVLELPTDRPRPTVQSFRGGRVPLGFEPPRAARLKVLGQRCRATLFMTLLAIFKVFLARYTGFRDIVVGTPVAGRTQVELEELIGFFITNVVLRTDLAGDPTFEELLDRIVRRTRAAYAHQEIPFELLVEELDPERDTSRSPIYQVVFNFVVRQEGLPDGPSELRVRPLDMGVPAAMFDLSMSLLEGPEKLEGSLDYDAALFDPSTVVRMTSHLETLARSVVDQPGARLSTLSLLTQPERAQLLLEWNDTAKPCAQTPLVHELFAEQARQCPDRTAMVSPEGERWTYGELEGRSNRLAHHLRAMGVGPEVLVAMCTGRTLDRAVGILGVVKAGGAYVSIDPTHPPERVAYLLDDAGAPMILTEERFQDVLAPTRARVLRLDADWDEIEGDEGAPPPSGLVPENLAYVVYTSGSTGKPKGVAIPHQGLMNLVRWHRDLYEVEPGDRGTQVASPAFDASIWEFWPYLTAGASLHIPSEEVRLSSPGMIRWWAREGVTLAYLMTPLAEGVLEEAIPPELDLEVRSLIIGGDQLHRGPDPKAGFRLMNHYGPAEYSVASTVAEVPPEGSATGRPTIGRPIDNTAIYLLDRDLVPVPIGVPGELWVAGVGLARGYLGRPALSAEKFLPHPFSEESGARIYRTGDLVRRQGDGDMDFLGRIDHQVKLRGLRIELGEIESTLDEHPDVREAAAAVLDGENGRGGQKRLVAWVTAREGSTPETSELRTFLEDRLPAYMVPAVFCPVAAMPLTSNGKIDRQALARLPLPEADGPVAPETPTEERLAGLWAEILELERVGVNESFFELGGHSLLMVRLQDRLREELDLDLPIATFFQYPTIRGFAQHLEARGGGASAAREPVTTRSHVRLEASAEAHRSGIAIIGMAGRFPGADDVGQFWRNLCDGVEAVSFFTEEELIEEGFDPEVVRDPHFVPAAALLRDPGLFDAGFFGLSPREAQIMDPQHRLFLECAWHALEDAGWGSGEGRGAVGVFAGSSVNNYLMNNLASNLELAMTAGLAQLMISNDKDHLPTRTSYKLNLKGPSVSVQTACSTSLVAAHMACESLLRGECDMALAGGTSVGGFEKAGYLYVEGGLMSSDGHCRAFDAASRGTVGGNGVGVVVLKRLDRALADGDSIYAVVKGSAINNDGADKVGYTAPSVNGQAAVIAEAQEMAGVRPESVGYVETHGTGTRLGDPIEIAALSQAFGNSTDKTGFCALSAVKTNIGHLDAGSGVAGLIKAALAVHHGQVPPSLHFESPNPEIDFEASPFFVNTELGPWPLPEGPRRAGVSSFGIGGTNAHVVLEQAPSRETPASSSRPASSRPWQLLVLSARSDAALEAATSNLSRHLDEHPELDPADVAYTCQVGRQAFDHRRVLVARGLDDAARALGERDAARVLTARRTSEDPPVAFLFSGLGDHFVGMGRELWETEPVFRDAVGECADLLAPELGLDLRALLYPEGSLGKPGPRAMFGRGPAAPAGELDRTRFAQPALFAVEVALARLWMSWGVRPRAMLGYSLGEYVAATLAGVLSLPDALRVVARRARLIDDLPPGAMLAVALPEDEVTARLGGDLSLAAVNGPAMSVVAGSPEAVDALAERLGEEGHVCRPLRTSHAFHSHHMEPILEPFRELLRSVDLREPSTPWISDVSGRRIRPADAVDPDYWVEHLRRPVRFADGARELWSDPEQILLEVGPGQTLVSLALQNLDGAPGERLASPSLPGLFDEPSETSLLARSLGRLWLAGVDVDWDGVHAGERRRRVRLPGYPFERQRHWISAGPRTAEPRAGVPARLPMEAWTHRPVWETSPPVPPRARSTGDWLLVVDGEGVGEALAGHLVRRGARVVTAAPGEVFKEEEAGRFRLDPTAAEHFQRLLSGLKRRGFEPRRIVHLGAVTAVSSPLDFDAVLDHGFYSFLALARAMALEGWPRDVELTAVTNGLDAVQEGEPIEPVKATLLGAVKVVPLELPVLGCRILDLDVAGVGIEHLAAELEGGSAEQVVALRGDRRFLRAFEPLPLEAAEEPPAALRREGVYLVTGGLGGLGLETARYLARSVGARLVLTGRSAPPSEETLVRELEESGAEVLILRADVTDRERMREVRRLAEQRWGSIDGVIHTAGMPGSGLVMRKTRKMAAAVLAPKVEGTRVLVEVFGDAELDFMVFYSSLAAIFGALGDLDYCAANAYLDALAASRPLGAGTATISINWDGWRDTGMGVRVIDERRAAGLDVGDALAHGLRSSEGTELFARVLARPVPQVVVSTRPLSVVEQGLGALQDELKARLGNAEASATPEASASSSAFGTKYVAPRGEMEALLVDLWRELLGVEQVGIHDNFFELGGHSLLLVQMQRRLNEVLDVELPAAVLFQHPTIHALSEHLAGQPEAEAETVATPRTRPVDRGQDVAILAMVGRFPGAGNVEEFWHNLCGGVESLRHYTEEELIEAGAHPDMVRHPDYVKVGGYLEGAELFDPGFFDISPREAQLIDPQHRIFLECAWQVLEEAGYGAAATRSSVGVFAGSSLNAYLSTILADPGLRDVAGTSAMVGNDKFHLTTQVSYKLNLDGPSVSVQTACSTSMVAVHMAIRSLLDGECDLALAGGVSVHSPAENGYLHEEGGFLSPDGHCRAFDAEGRGTIFGQGVGVVLLRPLADALRAGDPIRAVIKGTAINNDGSVKVGFTAPSVDGQAAVIREAQERGEVDPATIGYVETHGTGTRLGDPVEIAALTQAFRRRTDRTGYCAVGSVKTNIGHLDAASGIAGLIKAALAVERGQVPPSLHFKTPNPEIDFPSTPFRVNAELADWPLADGPRRAAVSSFGFGGTNVHAILEEAPPSEPGEPGRDMQLLALSARTQSALEEQCHRLADHLRRHPELDPEDVAYTLQVGRERFAHRHIVVSRGREEAVELLEGTKPPQGRCFSRKEEAVKRPVAFLFPGQGTQFAGMGRELHAGEKVFRQEADRACELLAPHLDAGTDLRRLLFGGAAQHASDEDLQRTELAQPALFVIEYALARLLMSWGVTPRAMLGHSIGEYVAACLAGVFPLADALALVADRGRLMQSLPEGAMLGISLPPAEVEPYLDASPALSLAAVNAPDLCVVSGETEAIGALAEQLAAAEIECRRLHTSHAFHSAMTEPILEPFAERVAQSERRAPRIRFVSNRSGTWIEAEEAADPRYWSAHLRDTVRFADGLACLLGADPDLVLLEVGPGTTLSRLSHRVASGRTALPSMPGPRDDDSEIETLMRTAGRLWISGVDIDWQGFHQSHRRRRVALPTYPFARQRYRIDAVASPVAGISNPKRLPIGQWTWVPSWRRVPSLPMRSAPEAGGEWLLFVDRGGLGRALADELRGHGCRVVTVEPAEELERRDETFLLRPGEPGDYHRLLEELVAQRRPPRFIVHAWTSTGEGDRLPLDTLQELGFYSLLHLAQGLAALESDLPEVDLTVVSNHLVDVAGGEPLEPGKATVLGVARVLPQELPHVRCRCVDFPVPDDPGGDTGAPALLAELARPSSDLVAAYRGARHRWVRGFEPLVLDDDAQPALRRGGTYLITGGLGQIGLQLALHLATDWGANLALVGRSVLPPRSVRTSLSDDDPLEAAVLRRIRAVEEIESHGGEVLVLQADVTDRGRMADALATVRDRFGEIHGVFHAAGVGHLELIPQKSAEQAAEVLAPKVAGSVVLADLLRDDELDFLVLFSSLASLVGGVGMVDYSAANAFLDALAQDHHARGGPRTLAVNWGMWLGEAADEALGDARMSVRSREQMAAGIRPPEGLEMLVRLLAQPEPQVVVSPRDLGFEMRAVEELRKTIRGSDALVSHPRPELDTPYEAPRDSLEEAVAELWQELIGIDRIGIHDNFYELGGHSLLGMQIASRVRERFQVEVSLDVMLGSPCVAELAAAILERQAMPVGDVDIEEIFAEIEENA